jgi:hypothetical protein
MTRKCENILLISLFFFIRSSTSDRSEGVYFTKNAFHTLEGNSIVTAAVQNVLQCCLRCERLPKCLSLNFPDVPDQDGLFKCILLAKDTSKDVGLLIPSQVYHHYTRFVVSVCLFVFCSEVDTILWMLLSLCPQWYNSLGSYLAYDKYEEQVCLSHGCLLAYVGDGA